MKKKTTAAKNSKTEQMVRSPRVSDINLMLSAHSRAFLKDYKGVLPPRLRSLLRHNLAGLSDDMQQFVCDNVITYLRTGFMFRSGVEHVDQRQGLLLLEMMNARELSSHHSKLLTGAAVGFNAAQPYIHFNIMWNK